MSKSACAIRKKQGPAGPAGARQSHDAGFLSFPSPRSVQARDLQRRHELHPLPRALLLNQALAFAYAKP